MRADRIVVTPPTFDDDLSLTQRIEDFTVEQFLTQAGVEALDVSVPEASKAPQVWGFFSVLTMNSPVVIA